LILRVYGINAKNLWFDEAWSWYESQRPFAEMIAENRTEFHPPLYHVLLKAWTMLFGQSLPGLRSLSLLASVGIVVLTYLLARRIMSDRAALIAAALLAVSAHQLYYAQEARMYALVAVFSLAATWCYVILLQSGFSSRVGKFGYVVCATLAVYTHIFALLLLAAISLHFLWDLIDRFRRGERAVVKQQLRTWLLLHLAVVIFFAPWLSTFFYQVKTQPRQDWRMPVSALGVFGEQLLFFARMIIGYYSYPQDLTYVARDLAGAGLSWSLLTIIFRAPVFYVIGLAIAVVCLVRGTLAKHSTRLVKVLFYAPLAAAIVILLIVKRHMDMARYLLLISPFYMLLIAVGLEELKAAWARVVMLVLLSLAVGAGIVNYYRVTSHDSDYRSIAAILRRDASQGDQIIVDPGSAGRGLRYYVRETDLEHTISHHDADPELIKDQLRTGAGRRIWLILDYRSRFFAKSEDQLLSTTPELVLARDELFPSDYPKIRLLLLKRRDSLRAR
jgi:uncharacterized membrane protein